MKWLGLKMRWLFLKLFLDDPWTTIRRRIPKNPPYTSSDYLSLELGSCIVPSEVIGNAWRKFEKFFTQN
jgi:hypothetical protein